MQDTFLVWLDHNLDPLADFLGGAPPICGDSENLPGLDYLSKSFIPSEERMVNDTADFKYRDTFFSACSLLRAMDHGFSLKNELIQYYWNS